MSNRAEGKTNGDSVPLAGLSRYGSTLRKAWPGYVPAAAMSVIIITTFAALFAGLVSPHDPIKQSLIDSRLGPAWVDGGSTEFLLGTDFFGRDILTRLIYGARISLSIGGLVILVGATVGTIVGISAGFFGGVVDSILMRIVDIVLSLPLILVAIVLVVVLGASTSNVILVVTLLIWPRFARVIRAESLSLRQQDFVTLAQIAGASKIRIMMRHMLPNVIPTMLVIATLQIGQVVVLESSLSFLGVGIPPPDPSWGVMVADGRGTLRSGWWISFFPGLSILLVVLSFNQVGDWLRDRLDPRLQQL